MSFYVKVLRTGGCNLGEQVGYLTCGEICEIGVSPFTEAVLHMVKHGDLALCQENGDLIGPPPAVISLDRHPYATHHVEGPGHSTSFLPMVNK